MTTTTTTTRRAGTSGWHFERYEARKSRVISALLSVAYYEHGMTQRELSRLSGLNVKTLSRWASGETRYPRLDTIDRLCAALSMTLGEAMEGMR